MFLFCRWWELSPILSKYCWCWNLTCAPVPRWSSYTRRWGPYHGWISIDDKVHLVPLTPAPLPEKKIACSMRCMTSGISRVAKELSAQRKCNTGWDVRPLVMFYLFEGWQNKRRTSIEGLNALSLCLANNLYFIILSFLINTKELSVIIIREVLRLKHFHNKF